MSKTLNYCQACGKPCGTFTRCNKCNKEIDINHPVHPEYLDNNPIYQQLKNIVCKGNNERVR